MLSLLKMNLFVHLQFLLWSRTVSIRWSFLNNRNQISNLLSLTENSARGLQSTNNEAIISSVKEIQKYQGKINIRKLEGKWDLLWTTEKETLFFVKNGLFGRRCTDVIQVIDYSSSTINNCIYFDGKREFSVSGRINIEPPYRTNFEFKSAKLVIPPVQISIPPVGKGWFDTVYLDDNYRVSTDSRGKYFENKYIMRRSNIVVKGTTSFSRGHFEATEQTTVDRPRNVHTYFH